MKKFIFCVITSIGVLMAIPAFAQAPSLGDLLSKALKAPAVSSQGGAGASQQEVVVANDALGQLAAFAELKVRSDLAQQECSASPGSSLATSMKVKDMMRRQGKADVEAVGWRNEAAIFAWCAVQPGVIGSAAHVRRAAEYLTESIRVRGVLSQSFPMDAQLAYEIAELAGTYASTKEVLEKLELFDARKERVVKAQASFDRVTDAAALRTEWQASGPDIFAHKNAGKSFKVSGFLGIQVKYGGGAWGFEVKSKAGSSELFGNVMCRSMDGASIAKAIEMKQGDRITVSGRMEEISNPLDGMRLGKCIVH